MSLKTKNKKDSSLTRRKPKSSIADSELIKGQSAAARYAGVSERTIRRWVTAGMPRTEDGRYIRGMLEFYKNNEPGPVSAEKKKGISADADYKDAKAKLMQIELQLRQGRIVPIDEIERQSVAKILTVKRAFLGLGRNLAPQMAKEKSEMKIKKIIDDRVKAIIKGFSS